MVRPALDKPAATVEEIQGLYGAFSFPEKLLQKIWLRGDFDRANARTTRGRRLRIVHPGKWNLMGGPDFRGARLGFDDEPELLGDVEVHLRAGDWDAHEHARDSAYDNVVLHVVLFPPESHRVTRGAGGAEIPMVALLPLLHHDLEEFAAEDAVEVLANRVAARLPEELGILPAEQLAALLLRHAVARWQQKVHFARLRVQRLGWEAACHHAALEILGYRFNRAPMLRIAGRWPLAEWARDGVNIEDAVAAESEGWSLQGVRPANHPRARLRQYSEWIRQRPDWPEKLAALHRELPDVDTPEAGSTRDARRAGRFTDLRERIADRLCANAIGGTRFDNLVCDGLFPLLTALSGRDLHALWQRWFPGDLPPLLTRGLRQLGVFDGREQPACHGVAQGLLGWLIERETRR